MREKSGRESSEEKPHEMDVETILFYHEKNGRGLYKCQGRVLAPHTRCAPSEKEGKVSSFWTFLDPGISGIYKPNRHKKREEGGEKTRNQQKKRENGRWNGITKGRGKLPVKIAGNE